VDEERFNFWVEVHIAAHIPVGGKLIECGTLRHAASCADWAGGRLCHDCWRGTAASTEQVTADTVVLGSRASNNSRKTMRKVK
jgi:hypothetical protein